MKEIKLLATLRDVHGSSKMNVSFETGSVHELIAAIRESSPAVADEMLTDSGDMSGLVHIFVNGRNIEWMEGLDTHIKESDILTLIPPTAGG